MNESIILKNFSKINLKDTFFDSLRNDYGCIEFNQWFNKKIFQKESAYILENSEGIQGFLYLKEENENDKKIYPEFPMGKKLKIGTFKINSHGTKLGERFIKIILDQMILRKLSFSYLTIYKKYSFLTELLVTYGFKHWGKKGNEDVYIKNLTFQNRHPQKDFPIMNMNYKKYILSIYPKYHTKLFPDSKLMTEKDHIIEDWSPTNCIEKIYLSGKKECLRLKEGDLITIYRTAEEGKKAEYNSVISSICSVITVKDISSFKNMSEFLDFCKKRTIFTEIELKSFWNTKKYPYLIIFQYNLALPKRIIRKKLIEEIKIPRNLRLTFLEITDEQFNKILELGEVPKIYFRG
ncbi:EVE domain-containing protein [Fusobacterium canifelinum]|uniref:hypothetical protein n=1 Tax=Fusobacterium canifelinum TaxID=285729 RepID=UPI0030D58358